MKSTTLRKDSGFSIQHAHCFGAHYPEQRWHIHAEDVPEVVPEPPLLFASNTF